MNKLNVSVEARAKSAMAAGPGSATQRKESNGPRPSGSRYRSNRSSNISQKSKTSKKSTGKVTKQNLPPPITQPAAQQALSPLRRRPPTIPKSMPS